jgi:hypothetical protein
MITTTLKNRRTKRTTITLEADVADFIQESLSKNKGIKEKQIINKLLRLGIKSEKNQPTINFKIDRFKTNLVSEISPEDIEKMLDEL